MTNKLNLYVEDHKFIFKKKIQNQKDTLWKLIINHNYYHGHK